MTEGDFVQRLLAQPRVALIPLPVSDDGRKMLIRRIRVCLLDNWNSNALARYLWCEPQLYGTSLVAIRLLVDRVEEEMLKTMYEEEQRRGNNA